MPTGWGSLHLPHKKKTLEGLRPLQTSRSFLEERNTKMRRRWFGLLLMVLLAACGGAPASAPTSAPQPTSAPAAAPAATAAPAAAPAATAAPEATAAPAATAAPEATAAPAATAAPEAAGGTVARKDILVIPSNVNIPAPDI